jgi:hypothetical protein
MDVRADSRAFLGTEGCLYAALVDVEITPEPSREERAAIIVALRELAQDPRPAGCGSAWWADGVRDNLEDAAEGDRPQ